jgi:hypothetical protein
MNSRQTTFLSELQRMADIKSQMYYYDKLHEQQWQEEFRTTKDNALDVVDLSPYGFTYTVLNQYVNNIIVDDITFWDGGNTLSDVERGKFARRIMGGQINLI